MVAPSPLRCGSSTLQDLPEFFEDHIKEWMEAFVQVRREAHVDSGVHLFIPCSVCIPRSGYSTLILRATVCASLAAATVHLC